LIELPENLTIHFAVAPSDIVVRSLIRMPLSEFLR
jgi:hypothetical protein